jgi:hypothetical protein
MTAVGSTSTGFIAVDTIGHNDSTYAFRHRNAPVVCEQVVGLSNFIRTFTVDGADTGNTFVTTARFRFV